MGVGGGGSNAVNRMISENIAGVDFIAVNTDPDAAIIKRCDYFAVADLFDIVPLLTSKFKAQPG